MDRALREAGIDDTKYCGHSFSMIKTLGRWRSLAYFDYIKIPRGQLANYSCILAS